MDAISRLSENLHLHGTRYKFIQGYGQWAYHIVRPETLIFYLVLEGRFCLSADRETRIAHKGDLIMLSHSSYHTCHALEEEVNGKHQSSYYSRKVNLNAEYSDIDYSLALHEVIDEQENDVISINEGNGSLNVRLILIECQYDKELTRPLLTTLPVILPECVQDKLNDSDVLNLGIEFLSIESNTERLGRATMINRLAGIFMIECVRTYVENLPDASDNWILALKDPYLSKALAVMHKRPDKNWTINSLAEVAGMSRSSFAERFKQIVGVPPLTYLIDYRLRNAARYLRLEQYSISRISELVGYASDSTFSQAFKRAYGVSPRQYRKQYQSETINTTPNTTMRNDVLLKGESISGMQLNG